MGILSFLGPSPKDQPGVYCITNRLTGHFYIGATTQTIAIRWDQHRQSLAAGTHHNKRLQADWDIYGPPAFRFAAIEVVHDPEQVFIREHYWQCVRYNRRCYNVDPNTVSPYTKTRQPNPLLQEKPPEGSIEAAVFSALTDTCVRVIATGKMGQTEAIEVVFGCKRSGKLTSPYARARAAVLDRLALVDVRRPK